jgi:hypothetical protein
VSGEVVVPGVIECVTTCTMLWQGREVTLKGIEWGGPGTPLPADDPFVLAHEGMFRPLVVRPLPDRQVVPRFTVDGLVPAIGGAAVSRSDPGEAGQER